MDSLPLFSKGKNCLWKNILGSAGAECESSKNEYKLMPGVLKKGKLLFLKQEQELVLFISKRNLLRRWMLVVPLKIIYIAVVWAPLYISPKLFSEKKMFIHGFHMFIQQTLTDQLLCPQYILNIESSDLLELICYLGDKQMNKYISTTLRHGEKY